MGYSHGYSHVYSRGYFHGWDSMVIQWMTGSSLSRSSTQSTGLGVFSMSRSVPWIAFCAKVPDLSMLSHGHPWLGCVRGTFISLPLASPPAIGSLMCTLGGSPREKQKRKEGEEEEGTKTKTKGCMFFGPGHPFFGPVHVFWTWPDFFWTWGHKKCGGCACVFSGPCGDIFFLTCMHLCGTQGHFFRQPN